MRLDHISYVASHDQISDVVNRIGSQIGTAFVDGGIHPKFGTRNFTAPLLNNQYIEVVCPLDHPATDSTPFGRAVKKKAEEGGGWLSWVLRVDNIQEIESKLGRNAIDGQRKKPDGSELKWKQIGVLSNIEDPQIPYFVQWISNNHPSSDGIANTSIQEIEICGSELFISEWLGRSVVLVSSPININWVDTTNSDLVKGVVSVTFKNNNKSISIT
jgi:hypothetical protein